MQRACSTILVSAAFVLSVAGLAFAHDVANPLTIFEPGAKIERAANAFHQKVVAAEAAGVPAEALHTARFVALSDVVWPTHNITVCFWNGTTELQDFVMEKASVWSDAANINFIYKTNGENTICQDATSAFFRINLDPEATDLFVDQDSSIDGDWSYIGRYSLSTKLRVTINLPDVVRLRDKAPIWTIHAIRHEFGHALALMHEHQRALCDPWFNYQAISKMSGWTVEFAKSQIGKFPDSELQYLETVGNYDQQSIMQYKFSKDEFSDSRREEPLLLQTPIDNLSQQDSPASRSFTARQPVPAASSARARRTFLPLRRIRRSPPRAPASTTLDTMMQAEAAGRSGKDPEKAKAAAAAFADVVAALKDFESMVPPR